MCEYSELIRWIREAKAGNEEAFAYIYKDTYSLVYNIACTSLGDTEIAKDVVSEVYIRVFRNLHQLRDEGSFVSWLSVITHHSCADYKRETVEGAENVPLPALGLEDEVEEWHRREALHSTVQEVMALLPESQQRAVQYVYFHQLSVGQAAALENCSIGTMKSRLFYARETLRRALADEEKRSGDKLHMPVGMAALAGLMMLPKMPFSLSSAEAALIFSSVMGALHVQYAADAGTAKAICLDRETRSLFRRRYLLRFTAGSAAAVVATVSAVMLIVGALTAYAVTSDLPGGSPDPSEDGVLAAKEEETEPALPLGTEVHAVTDHGAEIFGTVTGNGVRIHTVQCAAETLILPRDMESVPVTEIAEGAFTDGCDAVKYLHIGVCLRTVSGRTIADLPKLQSILVPDASPYLKSLNDALYTKDGRVLIAFPQDKRITSFTVPDGVETIGAYALKSRWLIKLTLPTDGLTTLAEYSLAGCTKITELRIPHSVSEIGRDALACPSLVTIYAASGEEKHNWSWNGTLLNYDMTHFVRYPAGKPADTYTLPSPVLTVGAYAFSGAENLVEIIIPADVKEIHAEAFVGCTNLQTITFRGKMPAVVGGDSLVLPSADCRIVQYTE